jgi:hypothetical protein
MSLPAMQVVWYGYISQIPIREGGRGDLFVPWFGYYLPPWLPGGGGHCLYNVSWWDTISFLLNEVCAAFG